MSHRATAFAGVPLVLTVALSACNGGGVRPAAAPSPSATTMSPTPSPTPTVLTLAQGCGYYKRALARQVQAREDYNEAVDDETAGKASWRAARDEAAEGAKVYRSVAGTLNSPPRPYPSELGTLIAQRRPGLLLVASWLGTVAGSKSRDDYVAFSNREVMAKETEDAYRLAGEEIEALCG